MAKMMIIKKGAEAELYLGDWLGFEAVFKRRVAKKYRNADLDLYIRSSRTSLEAKLLSDSRRIGVPTPVVYFVDMKRTEIVMSYISGTPLKGLISRMDPDLLKLTFESIGEAVGRLHRGGIVHGDLTTSNMMVKDDKIFFIDFGLGGYEESLEARGVDLHLMRRTLESSHYPSSEQAYSSFVDGYRRIWGDVADQTLRRVGEIRRRGRYVDGGRCMNE
jgi:TP53 regulating kinase-like protein